MITVELTYSKETLRKVVYTSPQGEAVPVSSVYIRKDDLIRLPGGGWPATITVSIEVAK